MLTFKEFVTELAREDVTLSSEEVAEMRDRFGASVLRMGNLQDDGSMLVSVDCIVEAARSLESHKLTEAAKIIGNRQMVSMLQSGEAFVKRVGDFRERKLRQKIRDYQNEHNAAESARQWQQIETEVFGVEFKD